MMGNWDWDVIPEGRVEWIGFSIALVVVLVDIATFCVIAVLLTASTACRKMKPASRAGISKYEYEYPLLCADAVRAR